MSLAVKLVFALLVAAAAWGAAAWVVGRRRGKTQEWWPIFCCAAGALVITIFGAALNYMTQPSDSVGAPLWVTLVSSVAMPGVALMNVFGRRALDDPIYFAGFGLNVFIWSTLLYCIRWRSSRASTTSRGAAAG